MITERQYAMAYFKMGSLNNNIGWKCGTVVVKVFLFMQYGFALLERKTDAGKSA